MSEWALAADAVSFAYDGAERVLHEVTVRIARGSITGILGPNGSGKTTLLRLLGGLLAPGNGRVELEGADLRSLRRGAVAKRLALVPQETQLAFEYTVTEMALMGRYPHLGAFQVEGPSDLEIAREALRATGTLHLESRLFNTLSGGEKQRVVIAAALAQQPDFLLLDEPTASLDLAYQLEIKSILEELNRRRGLTIVISTHDLNLACGLCRDLILLDKGRVLASGARQAVLDPALIRQLYGVEVEIAAHARTGQLSIVPLGRVPDTELR